MSKRVLLVSLAFLAAACGPLPAASAPTPTANVRCQYGIQSEFYSTPRTLRYDHGAHLENLLPPETPESQGMEGRTLRAALPLLEQSEEIFSLLVVRHGRIVLEEYFNTGRRDLSYNVHSVSKSILSALTGIAIEQGLLRRNTTVGELLPEHFSDMAVDDRRRTISVADLVSMTAGFDWTDNESIFRTDDWVNETLHLPLVSVPGARFKYSTAESHVLSAMIARATAMSTCEFACASLFDPLGITTEYWPTDGAGVHVGGNSVHLTAREMAVFGQLYLQGGAWNGRQVVPEDWVATSVQPKSSSFYGYYWWLEEVDGHPMYAAVGSGGQWIVVLPDLDIVVVSTADTRIYSDGLDWDEMMTLLRSYVVPSVTDGGSRSHAR